ncbi:hypothetical protein CJF12_10520 [Chryseobacterium piperi]|uniref:hypothetical protein n=1 Tax=Chryseobacterium piperi TaxID=558152 RepID=UPI00054EB20E|nr:hypothetical protein [Chryseobacterium piperi]ASW74673.2 hypothetical protein CJF12_10520 [Chryseobacterium piperi]
MNSILQKRVYLIITLSIICIVLLSAVKTTLDSFYSYYKEYDKNTAINNTISHLYEMKPLRVFNSYTGFETGYGFFGTNVSSDFVIMYDLCDKDGRIFDTQKFKLNTKEASIRFTSLNRLFLDKLTNEKNKMFDQYVDIVLKEISKYIYNKYDGKYNIHLKVYLYHYPTLKEYLRGKNKTELYLTNEMKYVK